MYIFMHMYIYTDRWIHTNTQYTQTCIQGHAYRHTIKNICMDMKGTRTLHRCKVYAGKAKNWFAKRQSSEDNACAYCTVLEYKETIEEYCFCL